MMDQLRYIQVDDFYKNPVRVRRLAIDSQYLERGAISVNVAGVESALSLYSRAVIRKLENIVEKSIECDPKTNAFGRFRVMCKNDQRRTQVHTDDTEYTAVIFLSLDEDSTGGTCFYRHKETGLDHYPNKNELKDLGISKYEFDQQVVYKDSLDETAWEVIDFCKVKFNRCIILRGKDYFHGSSCFFGSTIKDARITQNFFFNSKEAFL